MQDRVPLYPGRVKLTPVAGQENTYDMVRADQPTQAGTPLNKDSLLKDATAALFGLGTDAVPDDVLKKISPPGTVFWFAGNSAPPGSLLCDGSLVSRETYKILFSAIGTTFGAGDGSTTFGLPNLINKFIKGERDPGTVSNGTSVWSTTANSTLADQVISNALSTSTVSRRVSYISTGYSGSLSGKTYYVQPPNVTLIPCIKY